MSTNDVPGHKAQNADTLAMGCWAEHQDGSLIVVSANENGRVIYSMFDKAAGGDDDIVEYVDTMPETVFKSAFSWGADKVGKEKSVPDIKWTWHDKTAFPLDRIIGARYGVRHASATDLLSAAARVAQSLSLRAKKVGHAAKAMFRRIADAIDGLDAR